MKHPKYSVWSAMWDRCRNPNNPRYHRYGGRGITVDPVWGTFAQFINDMGECPPGHSLDRLDNDLDYGPDNCQWRTYKQQSRNRGDNRCWEWGGERLTLAEWEDVLETSRGILMHRLNKTGECYPLQPNAFRLKPKFHRAGVYTTKPKYYLGTVPRNSDENEILDFVRGLL